MIEMMGTMHMAAEHLGYHSCTLELRLDASAARGILLRNGSGKLKHLGVKELWGQQTVRTNSIEVTKITRSINVADTLCSRNGVQDLNRHIGGLSGAWPVDVAKEEFD